MNANDSTEAGEVPLTCNAGAGVGDDKSVLQIGINDGCGSFVEVAVYAAPSAFVCDIAASAGNWVCVIAHGQPFADTRNATDADMADLTIGLNGDANCSVPATIVLTAAQLRGRRARHADRALRPGRARVLERQGRRRRRRGRRAHVRHRPRSRLLGPRRRERELGGRPARRLLGRRRQPERRPALPGHRDLGLRLGHGPVVQAVGGAVGLPLRDRRRRRPGVHADRRHGRRDVRGDDGGRRSSARHTTTDAGCGPVTVAITLADGRVAKLRDDWC